MILTVYFGETWLLGGKVLAEQGLRYKASRKDKEVGSLSRRTDTDSQASQPGGFSGPQLG